MAAPGLVIFGVLQIGWKNTGQQERYILKAADLVAGVQILKQIAWGRTAFFADGAELDFARVSSSNKERDGIPVQLRYPLGPHPSWSSAAGASVGDKLNVINDPRVVAQMRNNTAAGKFWHRYIRYLPDAWVVGNVLPDAVQPYFTPLDPGTPPVDMTAGGAHLTICRSWWSYLMANTQVGTKVDNNNYNVSDYSITTFAQITSKKVGRRFRTPHGRLSVAGG